jgi:hypothetical protein
MESQQELKPNGNIDSRQVDFLANDFLVVDLLVVNFFGIDFFLQVYFCRLFVKKHKSNLRRFYHRANHVISTKSHGKPTRTLNDQKALLAFGKLTFWQMTF